ncbi:MAG TPA: hypothetical protein VFL36_16615 [Myxococcales bacterium]|nr:hypothetical protein [Myxococcales bacterium]
MTDRGAKAAPLPVARAPKHPLLIKPFAAVGLLAGLAGSTLGAVLILRIHLALGPVSPLWKQVHGQAQVFGFIVPLVVGFGTYLVPRVVSGRPIRAGLLRPAAAAFALAACADFAVPLASGTAALALRRVLALLIAAAGLAAAAALYEPLRAVRRGGEPPRGHERLLGATLAFLALGALVDAAAWWSSPADGDLPASLASGAWRLTIEGFAVGMGLTISARMFAGFLGIPPALSYSPVGRATVARERLFVAAAWAWAASVALGGAADVFASFRLASVADIVFAAGIVPLSLQLGLARTADGPGIDRTRDPFFPVGARAAYGLLALAAVIGAVAGAADLLGASAHTLWLDARRHLLTIGFLLTLIATMAGRLAPGFAGRPLALPHLRTFAVLGFAASALLRSLEGVAGQWGPAGLLWASGLSGPLAAAALVALAASLAATLFAAK